LRKVIFFSFLVAVVCVIALIVWTKQRPSDTEPVPELIDIGPSHATLSWQSDSSYFGSILYRVAGSEKAPLSSDEAYGPSDKHEVTITGLQPSTRYIYWLKGYKFRYQFQTQPLPTTPFSFLMVWGNVSDHINSWMRSELPEFIVSLTPISNEGVDPFFASRSSIPIYGPTGVDSPFLRGMSKNAAGDHSGRVKHWWQLDWGGLRLVTFIGENHDGGFTKKKSLASVGRSRGFVDESAGVQAIRELSLLLEAPAAHTVGVVAQPEFFAHHRSKDSSEGSDAGLGNPANSDLKPIVRGSLLHGELLAHNK
jgi:hypothetical protein